MSDFALEDDRPPIEVVAGSIQFCHGYHWEEHGGTTKKKWKVDQPNGWSVGDFEVRVTANGAVCCRQLGSSVTIGYTNANGEHTFNLSRQQLGSSGKFEPLLSSDRPMTRHPTGCCVSFDESGHGQITRVEVDGNPCNLTGKTGVGVLIVQKREMPRIKDLKAFLRTKLIPALLEIIRRKAEPRRRRVGSRS